MDNRNDDYDSNNADKRGKGKLVKRILSIVGGLSIIGGVTFLSFSVYFSLTLNLNFGDSVTHIINNYLVNNNVVVSPNTPALAPFATPEVLQAQPVPPALSDTLASVSEPFTPIADINGHSETGLLIGQGIGEPLYVPPGSIVEGVIGESFSDYGKVIKNAAFYFPDGGYIGKMGAYVLRIKERLAPSSLYAIDPENSFPNEAFYIIEKNADGSFQTVNAVEYAKGGN